MKSPILFLLAILSLIVSSCASDNKESSQAPAPLSAKEYVENNVYIDVKDFGETLTQARKNDPERVAQMKAANYRFYSHVKIIDNQYVCDLTSADQINVSPAMFSKMIDSLKSANEEIRKSEAEGRKVELGPLGEEYLNSLLEENSLFDQMRTEANKRK